MCIRDRASGKPHDGRAPDYDDWALNGDLLCWDPVLNCAVELSSMGIRVSPESLDRQLTIAGCDDRRSLPFHKALLAGELPLTLSLIHISRFAVQKKRPGRERKTWL